MQRNIVWKSISWEVIHGKKLGRTIWVPTANIAFESEVISPWVYVCNILFSEKIFFWVGSYQEEKKLFEVFIFDFSEDIYGQVIEVILLEKIRDNRKFEHLEALKIQIRKDIQISQELRFPVLTFGSFDIFHEGHKFYLSEAKKYGRQLITIIARDKTIEHIKGKIPHYDEQTRKKHLETSWFSDRVELWDLENPFIWLEKYKPKVIMLGYDQRGIFVEKLPEKLQEFWLSDTIILRSESLKPEIYKSSKLREALKK